MDIQLVIGAASVLLFVVLTAYFAFLVYHQRGVEPKERVLRGVELLRQHFAPGETTEQPTPYYVSPIPAAPDPLEISGNLDKKILAGAGMLLVLFFFTGLYFVAQPAIRAEAADNQLRIDIRRGKNIYANFCFDCHGKEGEGISGAGLPLNQPGNKYANISADPAKLKEREDLLRKTIERGRSKPLGQLSMPAWARSEGGALNDAQIQQILHFIEFGTPEDWADVVTIRQEANLALEPQTPKPPAAPTGVAGGRQLTVSNPQQPCTTCHSFTTGQNSPLPNAPNLGKYGVEGPFNDEMKALKAQDPQNYLFKWVSNAPSIKPGIAMPPFAQTAGGQLTDENIKAIVEYLQSLGK